MDGRRRWGVYPGGVVLHDVLSSLILHSVLIQHQHKIRKAYLERIRETNLPSLFRFFLSLFDRPLIDQQRSIPAFPVEIQAVLIPDDRLQKQGSDGEEILCLFKDDPESNAGTTRW